jgi:hypothetical protein
MSLSEEGGRSTLIAVEARPHPIPIPAAPAPHTHPGRARQPGRARRPGNHPACEVLAVRDEGALTVAGDYFGPGRPNPEQDDAKRPAGARRPGRACRRSAPFYVVKATRHVQP